MEAVAQKIKSNRYFNDISKKPFLIMFRDAEILVHCDGRDKPNDSAIKPVGGLKEKNQHQRNQHHCGKDTFHLVGRSPVGFHESAVAAFALLEFLDSFEQMGPAEIGPE